jgi:DNA-binding HxlR family transcriptional regulator
MTSESVQSFRMTIDNAERCAVLRTLNVLGDMWSLGILRCVFYGQRRYTRIQRELGIATNVLADRLDALVDNGILERVPYQDRPTRHEYALTPKGVEFAPAIIALREWGRRNFEWDETLPSLRHENCGGAIDAIASCRDCGDEVPLDSIVMPAELIQTRV